MRGAASGGDSALGGRMDLAHWGLRERPFRITVAPHGARLLPGQLQVHQEILSSFQHGERVAVMYGPHGVGKTLVAQQVVAALEEQGLSSAWAACVPGVEGQAVYQMLLADLDQPFVIRSAVELRLSMTAHLLDLAGQDKSIVVVCDEAQHLSPGVLEELRPMVDLVSSIGSPVVHVLLVGTEQIIQQMDHPSAAGLRAWMGCRPALTPLDAESAVAFLQHQWKHAGGQPRTHASAEAWSMLAELGQGIPLMMNRLARQAFHLAQVQGLTSLDAEAVWEAAHDLGLTIEGESEETVRLPVRSGLRESA
jgi:type II secretory pathway predicted ATPase ExeA